MNDVHYRATTDDGVVWWWIPVVAPHIGAILGVAIYSIFVEIHHDSVNEEKEEPAPSVIKTIPSNRVSASKRTLFKRNF